MHRPAESTPHTGTMSTIKQKHENPSFATGPPPCRPAPAERCQRCSLCEPRAASAPLLLRPLQLPPLATIPRCLFLVALLLADGSQRLQRLLRGERPGLRVTFTRVSPTPAAAAAPAAPSGATPRRAGPRPRVAERLLRAVLRVSGYSVRLLEILLGGALRIPPPKSSSSSRSPAPSPSSSSSSSCRSGMSLISP